MSSRTVGLTRFSKELHVGKISKTNEGSGMGHRDSMRSPSEEFAAGFLDEFSHFMANGGLIRVLKHGISKPNVYLYKNFYGKITVTYRDDLANKISVKHSAQVPCRCLNEDKTQVAFLGKTKALKFLVSLGFDLEVSEYILEWNLED